MAAHRIRFIRFMTSPRVRAHARILVVEITSPPAGRSPDRTRGRHHLAALHQRGSSAVNRAWRCAACRCCPTSARRPRSRRGCSRNCRLQLVLEQELQHSVALRLVQLVDAHRVAGVAVQHLAAGDRVREEHRVRRPAAACARCSAVSGGRVLPGCARILSQNLLKSCVAVMPSSRCLMSAGQRRRRRRACWRTRSRRAACRRGAAP